MKNGKDKNAATPAPQQQQQMQINPQQAAQFALLFMERASHSFAERQQFDIGYSLLQAIANGSVALTQATATKVANPIPESIKPPKVKTKADGKDLPKP